ncbi:MAG: DMT family transporter [Candidatus Marinimicrobia bacterium]|nr:DMT family transporter [Candidatus Neomarinimicrobiota bacterium]
MDKETQQAMLLAGLALLMWSTVATAFKLTLQFCTPYQLLFVSVITAALILTPTGFMTSRNKKIEKKGIYQALGTGLLMPLLYYTVLFIAYDRLPAQSAQIINFTWPVFMAIAAMILNREPVNFYRILFLFVSLTGAVVVITQGTFRLRGIDDGWGSFLAFGSALLWTTFWMVQSSNPLPSVLRMGLFFTSASCVMILLAVGGFSLIPTSPKAWLGGIYVGLFEMSLPFLVWQKALEKTHSVAIISNVIYLSPFLSLIYIHTILGETIHRSSLAGLLLISIGLLFQINLRNKKEKNN